MEERVVGVGHDFHRSVPVVRTFPEEAVALGQVGENHVALVEAHVAVDPEREVPIADPGLQEKAAVRPQGRPFEQAQADEVVGDPGYA